MPERAADPSEHGRLDTRLSGFETRLAMVDHDLGELRTVPRELRRDMSVRCDRLYGQLNERFDSTAGTTVLLSCLRNGPRHEASTSDPRYVGGLFRKWQYGNPACPG